jgi:hypothetical protein
VKSTVDLSVLHISDHAVRRYRERILRAPASKRAYGRAKSRLAALLHYAEPLPDHGTHDGYECHAWKLCGCVGLEKNGTLTTVITDEMFTRGLRSDA